MNNYFALLLFCSIICGLVCRWGWIIPGPAVSLHRLAWYKATRIIIIASVCWTSTPIRKDISRFYYGPLQVLSQRHSLHSPPPTRTFNFFSGMLLISYTPGETLSKARPPFEWFTVSVHACIVVRPKRLDHLLCGSQSVPMQTFLRDPYGAAFSWARISSVYDDHSPSPNRWIVAKSGQLDLPHRWIGAIRMTVLLDRTLDCRGSWAELQSQHLPTYTGDCGLIWCGLFFWRCWAQRQQFLNLFQGTDWEGWGRIFFKPP